jgi:hypothetical protein
VRGLEDPGEDVGGQLVGQEVVPDVAALVDDAVDGLERVLAVPGSAAVLGVGDVQVGGSRYGRDGSLGLGRGRRGCGAATGAAAADADAGCDSAAWLRLRAARGVVGGAAALAEDSGCGR